MIRVVKRARIEKLEALNQIGTFKIFPFLRFYICQKLKEFWRIIEIRTIKII